MYHISYRRTNSDYAVHNDYPQVSQEVGEVAASSLKEAASYSYPETEASLTESQNNWVASLFTESGGNQSDESTSLRPSMDNIEQSQNNLMPQSQPDNYSQVSLHKTHSFLS